LDEDRRIQEPSKNVGHLQLRFVNSEVYAEVVSRADSIEEAVQLAKAVCDQWLVRSNGENDVAKIAEVGTIVVSKQVAMAEDQEASAVGVTGDGNPKSIAAVRALTQSMPLKDLRAIADVVMDELARRRRPQNWKPKATDLGEVHGEVTGAEGPASPTTLGDAVADN